MTGRPAARLGRSGDGTVVHRFALHDREACVEYGGLSRGTRLAAHGAVSTSLALCSDRRLRELVDAGRPLGFGIGGERRLLDVGGTPVFVKQVRLTDRERRPENLHSTRNLFELPLFCHYGVGAIGGPGFGAWRELADRGSARTRAGGTQSVRAGVRGRGPARADAGCDRRCRRAVRAGRGRDGGLRSAVPDGEPDSAFPVRCGPAGT